MKCKALARAQINKSDKPNGEKKDDTREEAHQVLSVSSACPETKGRQDQESLFQTTVPKSNLQTMMTAAVV